MGGLFSKPKAPPPPPPPPPPEPMPDPDDKQIEQDKRKNFARQRQKSGRASTDLSRGTILATGGTGETLGG